MNAYDFDNTIYDGESAVDFYLFCLFKKISLIKYLPLMFYMLLKYKLGKISVAELEEKAAKYAVGIFSDIENPETAVKEFWDKNEHKIKPLYKKIQKADDVVISASGSFLLREICDRIGVKTLICSEINLSNGKTDRICFRSNKPIIFKQLFPDTIPENFYTDSINDAPMIEFSKNAYLVKKNKIKKIK